MDEQTRKQYRQAIDYIKSSEYEEDGVLYSEFCHCMTMGYEGAQRRAPRINLDTYDGAETLTGRGR